MTPRNGNAETFYEKAMLRLINVSKLKATKFDPVEGTAS
jgi:hypothetical protein